MTPKTEITRNHRRLAFWLGGAILLLLVVGIGFTSRKSDSLIGGGMMGDVPIVSVAEGPLTISVTASGTIRPRDQVILKNEVEGQTSIIYLIKEGTAVKKGTLLVELDSSQMTDQKVSQQIEVYNAEAAYINATETLAVVKNQAKADIDKATLDLEFAKQDLIQYKQGEFPKLEKEANAKITLAKETLQNAQNTVVWSKRLFQEKYLSETELKKDELAAQKAQLDQELAEADLGLLKNFTYKRNVATFESNLSQAEMALERVKRKASADLAQAEAQLKAKDAEFKQQQDQLTKIEKQLEKTKITAPMDGTVIYATSTRSDWHNNEEPLDEGQSVRERQELIYLPTTASFNVEIKVHEASLDKIQVGMPVMITVDALPGKSFTGKVVKIAPLPDAQSSFMNPDLKVYNTMIEVDSRNLIDLRNGMSCKAEIIVNEYPKAIYVPIQSVMRVAGRTVAYIHEGGQFKMRPITIGLDNNRLVHVVSGLKPGETVLLAPPLAEAEASQTKMDQPEGTNPRTNMDNRDSSNTLLVTGGVRPPGIRSPRGADGAGAPVEGRGGIAGRDGLSRRRAPDAGEGSGAPGLSGERSGGSERRGGRLSNLPPEERAKLRQRLPKIGPDAGGGKGGERPSSAGIPPAGGDR